MFAADVVEVAHIALSVLVKMWSCLISVPCSFCFAEDKTNRIKVATATAAFVSECAQKFRGQFSLRNLAFMDGWMFTLVRGR